MNKENKFMEKVLISACLIGDNTKYDGTNNYIKDIEKLYPLCDLVIICPEVFGGLSTPRSPSEIKNGRVINKKGKDVTNNFNTGANMSLFIAKQNNVKYAILKENSPSCGSNKIYDGSFTGKKVIGKGITTALLEKEGIKVFNEKQIDELINILTQK